MTVSSFAADAVTYLDAKGDKQTCEDYTSVTGFEDRIGVKRSLKGSKVKTIKVSLGKKSVNKKYVKMYKKIFTKKNAGRAVKVK